MQVIGVEAEDAAGMTESLRAGKVGRYLLLVVVDRGAQVMGVLCSFVLDLFINSFVVVDIDQGGDPLACGPVCRWGGGPCCGVGDFPYLQQTCG